MAESTLLRGPRLLGLAWSGIVGRLFTIFLSSGDTSRMSALTSGFRPAAPLFFTGVFEPELGAEPALRGLRRHGPCPCGGGW